MKDQNIIDKFQFTTCYVLHNKGNTIPYYGEDLGGYAPKSRFYK